MQFKGFLVMVVDLSQEQQPAECLALNYWTQGRCASESQRSLTILKLLALRVNTQRGNLNTPITKHEKARMPHLSSMTISPKQEIFVHLITNDVLNSRVRIAVDKPEIISSRFVTIFVISSST